MKYMMASLFIWTLIFGLFVIHLTPSRDSQFQIGDCIASKYTPEKWETKWWETMEYENVYQIVDIGKRKYQLKWILPKILKNELTSEYTVYIMESSKKVDCP